MLSPWPRSDGEVPERSIEAVSKCAWRCPAVRPTVSESEERSGFSRGRDSAPSPLIPARYCASGANFAIRVLLGQYLRAGEVAAIREVGQVIRASRLLRAPRQVD